MVLSYIIMSLPRVYLSSQSCTPLPPPFPYHLSGSSPCTSPKLPVSCIEPRLAIRFLHGHTHQQKNSLISTFFLPNGFIFSSHRRVISTWHSVWPVIASKCHSFHHREGWIIFSALKTPREELLLTLFGSDIHLSASQLWQEKAWCWLNWQLPPEPHSWNGVGVYACMPCRFSRVWLCMTLWTVAHQAPLSTGFSRQEYWSGLSCPPPGSLPDPGIELTSLTSPTLASRFYFFTTSATWQARKTSQFVPKFRSYSQH